MYIAIRNDLPPGLQAAQAAHSAFEFAQANPGTTREWASDSNYLILVAVPDEPALKQLLDRAVLAGITHVAVREPDIGDQVTCVCLAPGEATRRLCASLPLALREMAVT